MITVDVRLSADLISAAGLDPTDPSGETSRLIAVTLYKENRVSLARAAELCKISVEQFVEFAASRENTHRYGIEDLEADRRTLERIGF